ncbi:MAG: CPBP family intramembrane metalloprotease [Clostridia bacterium]|nr:CPBP family intramembrane metalloprotease [Clostridia bacterium]
MENYQNPNGQFGGENQNYVYYGTNNVNNNDFLPPYDERQIKRIEKRTDKRILRKLGSHYGLAVIIYVILSFAASFVIGLLAKKVPSLMLLFEDDTLSLAYSVVGSIIYIGLPFGLVFYSLKKKQYMGLLPFGTVYNKKAAATLTMLCVPIMLVSSMVVNFISLIIQEMAGMEFSSGLEDLQMPGIKGFIIATISMAVVPAIIEEFAIRGVVMQPLRRYGDKFAIVASAFIFSIMHGNMAQIPYTVIGGIYLGYLTVATGSIWPSIILHFINNMYSVVIMVVDTNFGTTWSGIVSMGMLAMFVALGVFGGVSFKSMNYKTTFEKGVDTLKTGNKISALFGNVPMIIAIIMMIGITITSIES